MSDDPTIDCAEHGETPWHGTVLCAPVSGGCGRLWHLTDENNQYYLDDEPCECGADQTSTFLPVCGRCFEQHAPRLPADRRPMTKDDLDQSVCHGCGVDHIRESLFLTARCHPDASFLVSYDDGVLHLSCNECARPVTSILVGG